MEKIEVIQTEPINHISRINEGIMKSFDNIMLQQNKMDNKAFIFIGYLSVIVGILCKYNKVISLINVILCVSIFILFLSLMPIATKLGILLTNFIFKRDENKQHNIFYYIDIYKLDIDRFKKILKEEYKLGYYTEFELKLIDQIIINAKILRIKVLLHTFAYSVVFGGIFLYGVLLILKEFLNNI